MMALNTLEFAAHLFQVAWRKNFYGADDRDVICKEEDIVVVYNYNPGKSNDSFLCLLNGGTKPGTTGQSFCPNIL